MVGTIESLRILVIDHDEGFQADLRALRHDGVEFLFMRVSPGSPCVEPLGMIDIVVIGVDTPAGLDLLSRLCTPPKSPPVIALAGVGFAGKSPEHVLVLAELRGAKRALPKPIEARELVLEAIDLRRDLSQVELADEIVRRIA